MSATSTDGTLETDYDNHPVYAILVLPENPLPGEPFRVVSTGGKSILSEKIEVRGGAETLKSVQSKTGDCIPYWRLDNFAGAPAGKYKAIISDGNKVAAVREFEIQQSGPNSQLSVSRKSDKGWDSGMEAIYSAWINALFQGFGEDASWPALHEVTRNKNQNFLYNCLSLGEDDPNSRNSLIMQPDCADNPFFLRAYFAWKIGLPMAYHICDRGYVGHNPRAGEWITYGINVPKNNRVSDFNAFLRRMKDGVQSGTARTGLDDQNSDYYPVSLRRESLRPGVVFADPYGHTLIIVGWIRQTKEHPGLLLSVDAQPDGTVGIKRFWKGNFLFNTTEVVGEPGFKAFRPISLENGAPRLMQNKDLTDSEGFIPFSLEQKKMKSDLFYHTMERLINPRPLDPEDALLDLIKALHEQLQVRITSVANGEEYFNLHPGAVIPMPSGAAAIFQSGGQWEDFSTPNRDLRLLIAMDAVSGFPDLVAANPGDFNISGLSSAEHIRKKLESILDKKSNELSITYTGSDGSSQKLTIGEILKRREAFEMAYNPNDGPEIRWGAPEKSEERNRCRRHVSASQLEKMQAVRKWFSKRLHPPT